MSEYSHPWRTELTKNANGGTELLMDRLWNEFGEEYLKPFQIIPSRITDLDPTKIRILWCHDLAADPMNQHLANNGWERFHKIVFVSYIQREEYLLRYGIPPSMTTVLHNSIQPIDVDIEKKSRDQINLVYHTTPHRGLVLLLPAFSKLAEKYKDIHLHVYSSFGIYGWGDQDERFKPLFDHIREHDQMTYHGFVSNDKMREALKDMHIFAYPSIWSETGCLALIEAMSAGCLCVHSNRGALPETASNWTLMYDDDEDPNRHTNRFYGVLEHAVNLIRDAYPVTELKSQKSYMDLFYSWELRAHQWRDLFENLKLNLQNQPLDLPKAKFIYGA